MIKNIIIYNNYKFVNVIYNKFEENSKRSNRLKRLYDGMSVYFERE